MIPTSRRSNRPPPMTDRDPCVYCGGNVGIRQETFDCDACHKWQHRTCNTGKWCLYRLIRVNLVTA